MASTSNKRMDTRPDLDYLLEFAERWFYEGDDKFTARFMEFDGWRKHEVSSEELAEVHPMLPAVVVASIWSNNSDPYHRFVSGTTMGHTLLILRHGVVSFTDMQGKFEHMAPVVDLLIPKVEAGYAYLSGPTHQLDYLDVPGERVPYIVSTKQTIAQVSRTELDARYPHWEQRFLVGQELGLELPENLCTVFKNELKPSIPMNDVTFTDMCDKT